MVELNPYLFGKVSTVLDLEGKDTKERLMGLHGTEKDGEMSLFFRCSDGKEKFGNPKPGRSELKETDSQAPDLVGSNSGLTFGTQIGDLVVESPTASGGGLYTKMAPAGEIPGHRGDELAKERIPVVPKLPILRRR